MHELAEAIHKARNLEDLLPILESLMIEVDRIVARKSITGPDMQKIAVYLTGIRRLLSELEQLEHNPLAGCDLAKRYLELEGKVKEIRNDLCQDGNPMAS